MRCSSRPKQRARFLDEACRARRPVRSEVDSLLAADEESGLGFSRIADGRCARGDGDPIGDGGLEAGELFEGRFRLLEQLGEGGMGQVWLAEQIVPVRRQVALKLIRAGMYDDAVVQRFRSERQSLAMMDHPAIAKVFEAGATALGQPYFVMEYVPGAADHRILRPASSSGSGRGSSSSSRRARACSTRTRRPSSIAT